MFSWHGQGQLLQNQDETSTLLPLSFNHEEGAPGIHYRAGQMGSITSQNKLTNSTEPASSMNWPLVILPTDAVTLLTELLGKHTANCVKSVDDTTNSRCVQQCIAMLLSCQIVAQHLLYTWDIKHNAETAVNPRIPVPYSNFTKVISVNRNTCAS
jgi:hypothetical protein